MPSEQVVRLVCHPSTPIDAVRSVTVGVQRSADGVLALGFRLAGDLARILVPAPRPTRVAHGLWEHTCFEAFVAVDGHATYDELNFSPSTEWAGYRFASYRKAADVTAEALAPEITVRSSVGLLALDARVHLARLSADYPQAVLRIGLSAVVEATDGALSYWSLHHPVGKPDFHHADARALRLEPPGERW